MGKPGTPAALEKTRSRRTPFTEIRDGRLLRQLRFAFTVSRGKPQSTAELLPICYAIESTFGQIKPWHRINVRRAAKRVARPIGRATTRGSPIIWEPIPELLEARGFVARAQRRREHRRKQGQV
jgi:hypothetical protein